MLNRLERIQDIVHKTASHMFTSMLNPEHRGPKFRFETFDIEGMAETQALLAFVRSLNAREIQMLRRGSAYHMGRHGGALRRADLALPRENFNACRSVLGKASAAVRHAAKSA